VPVKCLPSHKGGWQLLPNIIPVYLLVDLQFAAQTETTVDQIALYAQVGHF
jgi:hypothetical protein